MGMDFAPGSRHRGWRPIQPGELEPPLWMPSYPMQPHAALDMMEPPVVLSMHYDGAQASDNWA